jgi:hypothetical protein
MVSSDLINIFFSQCLVFDCKGMEVRSLFVSTIPNRIIRDTELFFQSSGSLCRKAGIKRTRSPEPPLKSLVRPHHAPCRVARQNIISGLISTRDMISGTQNRRGDLNSLFSAIMRGLPRMGLALYLYNLSTPE